MTLSSFWGPLYPSHQAFMLMVLRGGRADSGQSISIDGPFGRPRGLAGRTIEVLLRASLPGSPSRERLFQHTEVERATQGDVLGKPQAVLAPLDPQTLDVLG